MEIIKTVKPMVCNVPNCKNKVEYKLHFGNGAEQNIFMCKTCLENLHSQISKNIVPKCIENKLKKPKTKK